MSHNEDEAIELFDWCGSSAQAAVQDKEALAEATAKVDELEQSVAALKTQLDELIKAKEADETALLEKFRNLLNEKKVKIRQQHKIIASASLDEKKLAEVEASQGSAKWHNAEPSRASKRKAAAVVEDESSDDGFEKMEVDQQPVTAPEPGSDDETTDAGTETASEEEEEMDDSASVARSMEKPPAANTRQKAPAAPAPAPKGKGKAEAKEEPPAKRELPFAMKKGAKAAAKSAPPPRGSETESDDEL